jgi:hypothetical protein
MAQVCLHASFAGASVLLHGISTTVKYADHRKKAQLSCGAMRPSLTLPTFDILGFGVRPPSSMADVVIIAASRGWHASPTRRDQAARVEPFHRREIAGLKTAGHLARP